MADRPAPSLLGADYDDASDSDAEGQTEAQREAQTETQRRERRADAPLQPTGATSSAPSAMEVERAARPTQDRDAKRSRALPSAPRTDFGGLLPRQTVTRTRNEATEEVHFPRRAAGS